MAEATDFVAERVADESLVGFGVEVVGIDLAPGVPGRGDGKGTHASKHVTCPPSRPAAICLFVSGHVHSRDPRERERKKHRVGREEGTRTDDVGGLELLKESLVLGLQAGVPVHLPVVEGKTAPALALQCPPQGGGTDTECRGCAACVPRVCAACTTSVSRSSCPAMTSMAKVRKVVLMPCVLFTTERNRGFFCGRARRGGGGGE